MADPPTDESSVGRLVQPMAGFYVTTNAMLRPSILPSACI